MKGRVFALVPKAHKPKGTAIHSMARPAAHNRPGAQANMAVQRIV